MLSGEGRPGSPWAPLFPPCPFPRSSREWGSCADWEPLLCWVSYHLSSSLQKLHLLNKCLFHTHCLFHWKDKQNYLCINSFQFSWWKLFLRDAPSWRKVQTWEAYTPDESQALPCPVDPPVGSEDVLVRGGRNNVGDFLRNGKSEKRQRIGMGDSPNLDLVIQIVDANLFLFWSKFAFCPLFPPPSLYTGFASI